MIHVWPYRGCEYAKITSEVVLVTEEDTVIVENVDVNLDYTGSQKL